ncbi:hypothetical protein D9615_008168 [Tricholomella constricta]|uniref:Uncharacterized protein n=1 Tax=Tricholomella constricta TaxID=117010 RepID=A0A8H5H3E6_9AGAR|nr:hypothetical protein D9615_008168 [Tricholomella constricta]
MPQAILLTTRFDPAQPLFILSSTSTFLSVTIFTLSMLDLGTRSAHLTPIIAGLTLAFHTTYFVLRRRYRLRPSRRPFPPAVALWGMLTTYVLCVGWFAPLVLTVYEAVAGRPWARADLKKTLVHGSPRVYVVPQAVLIGLETVLFVLVAVLVTVMRREARA